MSTFPVIQALPLELHTENNLFFQWDAKIQQTFLLFYQLNVTFGAVKDPQVNGSLTDKCGWHSKMIYQPQPNFTTI